IKINCVAIRGFNDDEVIDFLKWGEQNGLSIRFIEFMPLDGDHNWKRENVMTQAELLKIAREYGKVEPLAVETPTPAAKFLYSKRCTEFGLSPYLCKPFCAYC